MENMIEKIRLIQVIIFDYENKKCPYCHQPLHKFLNKDEVAFGCDGNGIHESYKIEMIDYIESISLILKYGTNKKEKFKKLSEF